MTAILATECGHSFREASVLDKVIRKALQLAVKQIIRLIEQYDRHVRDCISRTILNYCQSVNMHSHHTYGNLDLDKPHNMVKHHAELRVRLCASAGVVTTSAPNRTV